MTKTP